MEIFINFYKSSNFFNSFLFCLIKSRTKATYLTFHDLLTNFTTTFVFKHAPRKANTWSDQSGKTATGASKFPLNLAPFLLHFSCIQPVCSLNSHFRAGNIQARSKTITADKLYIESRRETNIFHSDNLVLSARYIPQICFRNGAAINYR